MTKHKNWMSVYDDKSKTAEIELLIAKAIAMTERNVSSGLYKDEGTCVIGAGIAIEYRGYRKRNSDRLIIVDAPYQGNVGSWKACQDALRYLKENGVNCEWYDGRMD